ncbi:MULTISPECIES: DUF2812 domain-containing protein [Bacillus]|uniref:DUF2812 domain-containing protein n=3 Tax=Bacillus toyonensis TaxID=155322 RepID=A0A2C4G084_9BACI|nr:MULTISPECIES: DUF2812 domain-containing protein [Bacillus]KAF6553094.1 DUF2812 domain-containing protein [Bacillus sp. EKM202B]MBJ8042901.1 DUF2812 domain-containing protein [Bacillus cereus group sp. N17]MBJ8048585.1 DUF2812 domain-containing protein [Bacillus cereus group sp. N18]MCU5181263.1 DUF2812 domain-containing protein [Bacillus toyonensis]MCU5304873.1 DUF2812 domain-containing protein [Bacillus toyonensis]
METRKVFKFFAGWSLEKEEAFLRKMHQQGWALQKYNIMYTFKETEPKDVIYKADFRLDYKDTKEKQKEYIEIYEMCGWKHVTSFAKWNYFCKEVEEENELPDIYSEKDTRIQKLNELLLFFVIVFVTIMPTFYLCFLGPSESRIPYIFKGMVGFIGCMYLYIFINITWKIKQLKKEIL